MQSLEQPGMQAPFAGEKEALRIQAAAVVAQQAALAEAERRLARRAGALKRQQAQLAAHLEDKHRRLLAVRNQVREERAAVLAERAHQEKHCRQQQAEFEQATAEIAAAWEEVRTERARLIKLRKRLRQRLHRHWLGEREALRQRFIALQMHAREVERHSARLEMERTALLQTRLHVHSECTVVRKELEAERTDFQREQDRWLHWRQDQERELAERRAAVEAQEALQTKRQRQLAAEADHGREARVRLEQEAEGLENRVRNLRRKLAEQATAGVAAGPLLAAPRQRVILVGAQRRAVVELNELAGALADQRQHLREMADRLQRGRDEWHHVEAALVAEFQRVAERLRDREAAVAQRELAAAAVEQRCQRRHEQIDELQRHLDVCQARLTVRLTAWETERERTLADVKMREELARRQTAAVELLRQRWQERRRGELERLRIQVVACGRLRRAAASARQEWLGRQRSSPDDASALVAAEALRQIEEKIGNGAGQGTELSEALQKLRAFVAEPAAWQESVLTEARRIIGDEAAAVDARYDEWRQFLERLVQDEQEFGRRRTVWEHQRVLAQAEQVRLRQDCYRLRLERDAYQRQAADIDQEVERLAAALLGSSDETPAAQAAA